MPASTVTLYKNNTQTVAFALVSSSANQCRWIVSGRSLAAPFELISTVKAAPQGAQNDVVEYQISRKEVNVTTGKLATLNVKVSISIPKDQSILTPSLQVEQLSLLASLLIDAAATGATSANRTAMIEGRFV